MKRLALTLALLGLAACSKKEAAAPEPAPMPAAPAVSTAAAPAAANADMAAMGMASDTKMAKGTGTVTAIDAAKGTITLDHGPIPEANWPAMTMGFKASPEIVKQVKVGDKVAFELKLQGGAGEVTAIQKQ